MTALVLTVSVSMQISLGQDVCTSDSTTRNKKQAVTSVLNIDMERSSGNG
jgi:hypothetical protein